jgi:hypothetical protein
MMANQQADSPDRGKNPDIDVESALPYFNISLRDEAEDSDSSSDGLSKPIIKDNESDLGAWICVLGSLLFLIFSSGWSHNLAVVSRNVWLNDLQFYIKMNSFIRRFDTMRPPSPFRND